MQKIPLHLLEAFIAFCDADNIVAAAARLGISQPALSKQLKLLESHLEQPLFVFRGRRKVLTSYGHDLHLKLKEKVTGLQEIVEQTTSIHSDPKNSKVRIATRREIIDRFADQLKFPGSIQFLELANEPAVDAILNRRVDIAIVHKIPDTLELFAKPLFKDHFMFAVPKKLMKQIPSDEKALWKQLMGLPCVCYKLPDDVFVQVCKEYDIQIEDLKVVRTTANYLSVAKLVNAGIGWALMPTHITALSSNVWCKPVSLKVFPPRQFYGICRPELKNAPWLRPLLKEIEGCFKP